MLEQLGKLARTRVPLEIKVVVGIAPALAGGVSVTLRTMLPSARPRETHLKGLVTVANILEPVDLVLWRKQGRRDRVDRRVSPALIVETSLLVEVLEKVEIRLGAPEVEVADFKVAPD